MDGYKFKLYSNHWLSWGLGLKNKLLKKKAMLHIKSQGVKGRKLCKLKKQPSLTTCGGLGARNSLFQRLAMLHTKLKINTKGKEEDLTLAPWIRAGARRDLFCFFLMVLWIALQCANVAFPGHTQLHLFHFNTFLWVTIYFAINITLYLNDLLQYIFGSCFMQFFLHSAFL